MAAESSVPRHSTVRVTDVAGTVHTGEGASVGEAIGNLEAAWRITPAGQAPLARLASMPVT
jgi:hypothetical protein